MEQDSDVNEVRVNIRHTNSRTDDARPVPAQVFHRTFNAFYHATSEAIKEVGDKPRERLVISDLRIGSNEFAFAQTHAQATSADGFELFRKSATSVYRNEFGVALAHPKLAAKIVSLGRSYNKGFATIVTFKHGDSLPIDHFFACQVANLRRALRGAVATQYFAGSAIDSFIGILGEIDYTRAFWTGRLVLSGSKEIECTFDKSKGEDQYNRHGNKRVSVTGRSIYRGDSLLPSRLEVIKIEQVAPAVAPIDIRGSLILEGRHFERSDFH